MGNVGIPRQPDVVTILWSRNPLQPSTCRRIVDSAVIGSANPCGRFLQEGARFSRAEECLLANGFKRISQERFDVYGVATYIRQK